MMRALLALGAIALGVILPNTPAEAAHLPRGVGYSVTATIRACDVAAIVLPCTVNGRIFSDAIPHPNRSKP